MLEYPFPQELVELLRRAARVAALTGAGVSQESGLRTFRDALTGLWSQYRPEDLATPAAFERNPGLVWEWYAARRRRIGKVQPNPAHAALAEMGRRIPEFTLLIQNVDGLHQRAGSREVVELHGNITRVRCSAGCGCIDAWDEQGERPPGCPKCGARLRPDVVWFGERLPAEALERAMAAARSCQVFFSIGTSGLVQPAASLASIARQEGAALVEVNLNPTPLSSQADFRLPGKAGEVLPELVRVVWG
jgi:NAD-dependent deacetylase